LAVTLEAPRRSQIAVAAAFDDAAVVEHEDFVGVHHRRSEHPTGPAGHVVAVFALKTSTQDCCSVGPGRRRRTSQ